MRIKAWKQQLVAAVLCICVLTYTIYHVASLFGEDLITFAASTVTETDSVSGSGYVFRDETVLYSDHGGVVNYLCTDGKKVQSGQALAEVYDNGTGYDRQRMAQIDRQIAVLEQSMDRAVGSTDIATLSHSIDDQYYMLSRSIAAGETGELSLQIENMLVGLNRFSVMTEENSAVSQTLQSLTETKEKMLSGAGNSITEQSPEGGYFYTDVDGYESLFTEAALESLTPSSYYAMIASSASLRAPKGQTAYGKLAKDSTWGFVMEIPFRSAEYFEKEQTYLVQFTENSGALLPMTLTRMVGSAETGTVLLILSCDRLPDDFDFNRCQSARIETSRVSGIYVPRRAVVHQGDDMGVYILRGSVVHFRHINVVYEGRDYYLVSEKDGSELGVVYLAENDIVIVGGQNLFDGRIMD